MSVARSRAADFCELTKPRITGLVVMTSLSGYLAGVQGPVDWALFLHLLIGTAMAAGGAGVLNQVMERDIDARMHRTMTRPIPAGRVGWSEAVPFGLVLAVGGCLYMWAAVGSLTALIAAFTVVSYLLVYTPLKRVTSLSTVIGAVPGALPPVGGWAASRNDLPVEAWVLFGILFLWQLPHFLAIAWICREDYARAGCPMLPVRDHDGSMTGRQITLYVLALLPLSLVPTVIGSAGVVYFGGALVLGAGLLYFGVRMMIVRSAANARRVLLTSVVYLPLLLGLLVLDRVPGA